MPKAKWMAVLVAGLAMGLSAGCGTDDETTSTSGGGGGGGGGDSSTMGSYAGTWTGNVCGRGLTINVTQNGSTLTGSYTFTGPTFNDTFSGSVDVGPPPATAMLRSTGGHDFWFEVTFTSYNSLVGGFYKSGVRVCDVNATK